MKKEILEYKELLRKYFSKETAHPSCQNNYEKNDCSYGQCAITSMLVFKKFGGTINKINLDEESSHYFNIINNEIIDLTKEQYKNQLDYCLFRLILKPKTQLAHYSYAKISALSIRRHKQKYFLSELQKDAV